MHIYDVVLIVQSIFQVFENVPFIIFDQKLILNAKNELREG